MSEHVEQSIDDGRILELELSDVIPDEKHEFQVRESLSQEKVDAMAVSLKSRASNQQNPYPMPIYVYRPDDNDKYIIVDGWHNAFWPFPIARCKALFFLLLNVYF